MIQMPSGMSSAAFTRITPASELYSRVILQNEKDRHDEGDGREGVQHHHAGKEKAAERHVQPGQHVTGGRR